VENLVPTLCVGTHVGTLRVPDKWLACPQRDGSDSYYCVTQVFERTFADGTQNVPTCDPTQSVGTSNLVLIGSMHNP